ncbi:MAG: hypothetical protein GY749_02375 [Desulfobacteraceae bacterium]|nr:hypothetical protein [Desulfobacteraceae bacterium]
MKQKYTISIDGEKNEMTIREYAELDKELLSLLCEETYSSDDIRDSVAKSKEALIVVLRTHNMYPPFSYINKIADSVTELYSSGSSEPIDIFFDDMEFLTKEDKTPEIPIDDIEEESDDIDDLLEDDLEEEFDDKNPINPVNTHSSIKIADDESLDIEEEG